jgi:hypothetical protein
VRLLPVKETTDKGADGGMLVRRLLATVERRLLSKYLPDGARQQIVDYAEHSKNQRYC